MAGFTNTLYEADSGEIHRIRLSKATVAVTGNPAPTGTATSDIKVKVSKNDREAGLRPRFVRLEREIEATVGEGEAAESITVKRYARIPILTDAVWEGAVFAGGATVSYAGETWKVSAREVEDY